MPEKLNEAQTLFKKWSEHINAVTCTSDEIAANVLHVTTRTFRQMVKDGRFPQRSFVSPAGRGNTAAHLWFIVTVECWTAEYVALSKEMSPQDAAREATQRASDYDDQVMAKTLSMYRDGVQHERLR